MSTYKVGRKVSTLEIEIIPNAATLTSGFTSIGTFHHDDVVTAVNATDDELEDGLLINTSTAITAPAQLDNGNHVLWHHVRELLYAAGEINPSRYTLLTHAVTGLSSTPATVTLAAAATQQITNTFTPANALDNRVTYSTSDAAKATVSGTGLITAVATGSATITVTHTKTGLTDTVVVTIS